MKLIEELNYERIRESLKDKEKTIEKLLTNIINAVPRDTLIQLLKKKKIIQKDWEAKGEKYNLK